RLHRIQRRAALQRAVTHPPHCVPADALDGLLPLLLRRDQLRVLIQHEHELHRPPLLSAAFAPSPLRHHRNPQIDTDVEPVPAAAHFVTRRKILTERAGFSATPIGQEPCAPNKPSRSAALVFGLAAAAAMAVPASASASADASPVVGHVYVNDNTKGTNTIGAFDRHADGTLTPQAGSPFAAGGAGTGSGLATT